jgi:hypothetical protein
MVEAPGLRGAHKKKKPTTVKDYNKYKIGVNKPDQMLLYHLFQRKSVKVVKKLFFHSLILSLVNAHILHLKTSSQKLKSDHFLKKLAEGLL